MTVTPGLGIDIAVGNSIPKGLLTFISTLDSWDIRNK